MVGGCHRPPRFETSAIAELGERMSKVSFSGHTKKRWKWDAILAKRQPA